MDWGVAIGRNRAALLRLVGLMFAAIGAVPGGAVQTLPRGLRYAVLRLLRPAESAARRLVVIEVHRNALKGQSVTLSPPRAMPEGIRGSGESVPCFRLIDPRKRFEIGGPRLVRAAVEPRISILGLYDPVFVPDPPAAEDKPVSALRLSRRLQALQRALEDLPAQARRLARWEARRLNAVSPSGKRRLAPLRPGWPPGHRQRRTREVDEILSDCHALALYAMQPPDTS